MNQLVSIWDKSSENDYLLIFFSFICCSLASFCLKFVYEERSSSLSGKYHVGLVIPILSQITFLIILIVKSSLALSLGLIGALSIVRFRTPIKEPEELVYLFLAIALGIGFGAGQIIVTSGVFVAILFIIWFFLSKKDVSKSLGLDYNLVIQWSKGKTQTSGSEIENIINKLKETFTDINIVRVEKLEEGKSMIVARINLINPNQIEIINNNLEKDFKDIRVSFYESKFIY
jgi:hypothetical protein|tara:strand:- start:49 stop:741 length:693 start_codon:yes stop_codon:yes gene_type:complete